MINIKNNMDFSDTEYIFMKLGISCAVIDGKDTDIDGEGIIKLYIKDEIKRGFTWFSTQAWSCGMSKKQVNHYNKKINSGKQVKILFAINNKNFDNDIAFSANIIKICSTNVSKKCPEKRKFPVEFYDIKARTWFKLKNIVEEDSMKADMFEFLSTYGNLKQRITNSQCIRGYVSLIKDCNG